MKIHLLSQQDTLPQTVLVPFCANDHLSAHLSQALKNYNLPASLAENFKADYKEIRWINNQSQLIGLCGLGQHKSFAKVSLVARSAAIKCQSSAKSSMAIDTRYMCFQDDNNWGWSVGALINGLIKQNYRIGKFKSKDSTNVVVDSIGVVTPEGLASIARESIEHAVALAETQLKIFDLVNAPANKKTPAYLAKWSAHAALKHDLQSTNYIGQEVYNKNLFSLWSVSRGSAVPPAFIQSAYTPPNYEKTVVLVGKGVTFDTGGVSLKSGDKMELMKSDMGGAAAVLGAIEVIAKEKLPIRVIAIAPTTENCIDGESTKPSDVINTYSGKTIEIINTDAEGRLVLADGLNYGVKNYQPDYILSLATLTGSIVRALGYQAAGLFSKNDNLAQAIVTAGERTGELVWKMPMWDEYLDDMKSDVADIRNLGTKPVAGAITAAKFLEYFTEEHPAYAHLDIAGMAIQDSEFSGQRSATAYGVHLLVQLMKELI